MAECPVCGGKIELNERTVNGELLVCSECGTELEVTGKDSVQEAPKEEEDWGQ